MHPTLTKAAASADGAKKRIERVADLLAKLMQEMHGGDWRFEINHEVETEFILITQQSGDERPVQPVPEVA